MLKRGWRWEAVSKSRYSLDVGHIWGSPSLGWSIAAAGRGCVLSGLSLAAVALGRLPGAWRASLASRSRQNVPSTFPQLYRGWLVRRICCILAVGSWKVLTNTPGDLLERVCSNKRVQDVAASQACSCRRDSKFQQQCKEKVLGILARIQAPLCFPMLRLCCWALLRFLSRLFLSVQLHRGQLEMVLRAARTPSVPLVFLSTHKSQVDGLLLSFLLFSQGLGVPRVMVGNLTCSPRLRALLSCLGAVFLPTRMEQALSDQDGELPAAVLASYVEEVLRSQQPLVVFLEEPCALWHLSVPARAWLAPLYRAVRDGAVPDILLVPVGIAYDQTPDRFCRDGAHGAQPLSLGACLWAACRALCRCFGCARVDLAQPFSLQEFVAQSLTCWSSTGKPLEELLPTILGVPQPVYSRADGPEHRMITSSEAEEETMVTKLGLHALSDAIACSAVTAVGITSALLLHKHRKCVRLSQLMADFAWLLEETLLRQHDVSFSGQLRALVLHSLTLLRAHLTLYHLAPLGDIMVVVKDSAETQWELSRHSAQLVPVFASEAVGACAIRALLLELLPFVGEAPCPSGITFSEDELYHKILALLQLLPPSLLGLKPCQPLDCQSQDVLDKLTLCGLLETEEEGEHCLCDVSSRRCSRTLPWTDLDFSDSDSDDNHRKRCFRICEPKDSPGFLLFFCHLLSPVLATYVRAVAFLEQNSWPQPEAMCACALQQFLAEEDGLECPTWSLVLSTLQSFKNIGVLKEMPSPLGPLLHLVQPFSSSEGQGKLRAFLEQFMQL
ncbi:glycerol-3-phosphate acyltransferase 2, mitochondrial isoform X3 [Meleagris gallopavo]|uniref:Glycerol-3-phosphate acyltransferase 2, mitochondrial n=1 Tax=Meleagris gallopavo TaxID=9103 RepID=A0A803XSX6_MELGA|nr:glycerol-3-phosphate acyltransferase 2, mitochondrial isoform X3 [Meleagris gallopavo]XP_010726512.1 glycerol-3-phosphate acyltransferase 2, mitochondrial isoform X3 [Meleagris gallopavo]XP_010726513.1 glycerol-3-phosphate acyltransferase 2, mitochondrial isoform X3 [Meleagris gallopavo]XP_019467327.1 glycerol-3-phosphate acyltransferase 2, mitochondrial isoform X3 [Meleagris gallopavo]